MNRQFRFPRKLTGTEQDALLSRLDSKFEVRLEEWQPLLLNNQPLGFLNGRWRMLLERDWQGGMEGGKGTLNLVSQDWLSMADALQTLAQDWCDRGEFHGWRNEKFDVKNEAGEPLFALERSAFRPLGLLSHAVHINGLAERGGETCFWIGRRSPFKAVDPDKLDNIVGGGIASGETVRDAMMREGWEEAGLEERHLAGAQCRSRLLSLRSVPRGLHREWLHIFDVVIDEGEQPENQDGEVADFRLMGLDELIDAMVSGRFMNDAMLATLDCCRRYGLLDESHPLSAELVRAGAGT